VVPSMGTKSVMYTQELLGADNANGAPDLAAQRDRDFLEQLHDKRQLLMGDSMNRNQFESMLCARPCRTRPDVRDARAYDQQGPRLLHLRVHGNNKSVECGIMQSSMEARVIIFLSQYGFHSESLVFLISMFFWYKVWILF
jgi:hypothetical protein